ncbi:MAG: hypothetical protein V4486_00860 [Patescibacteria group bacterium]
MKNKKLIRFVQSLILLPITTSGLQVGNLAMPVSTADTTQVREIVFMQRQKEQAASPEAVARKAKADAIDAYFKAHEMPLVGTGEKMVDEADKNDLDWRLIPAISVRESTGGKHDCQKVDNNPFGWGSCKIGFKSVDVAIETIARNLGGNNPVTARHYDNKTTLQILNAYNPPSIVPKYAPQVLAIMKSIGAEDLGTPMDMVPA